MESPSWAKAKATWERDLEMGLLFRFPRSSSSLSFCVKTARFGISRHRFHVPVTISCAPWTWLLILEFPITVQLTVAEVDHGLKVISSGFFKETLEATCFRFNRSIIYESLKFAIDLLRCTTDLGTSCILDMQSFNSN
ncbi:hypothetical protein K2173_000063 [Erythroxylum novogranatense]|uniref:Uncharacterized protein n=1 Tax=Erythroxylum novogranatense TaxID=1862640 RepID=A0AAV8SPF0_9ROSI|nr:hypothetical protein K2173_000063 [Erythroxylum novogranatense]